MAPEIVCKKCYFGFPVDVWALGVLLYVMLCGKFPFKGIDDKSLFKEIMKGELFFPEYISLGARYFL